MSYSYPKKQLVVTLYHTESASRWSSWATKAAAHPGRRTRSMLIARLASFALLVEYLNHLPVRCRDV